MKIAESLKTPLAVGKEPLSHALHMLYDGLALAVLLVTNSLEYTTDNIFTEDVNKIS